MAFSNQIYLWKFFITRTCRNPTHLELFIFLSCLFGTVGSAVVPWCKDLWMLALMLHIEGWGQAFINTGRYHENKDSKTSVAISASVHIRSA